MKHAPHAARAVRIFAEYVFFVNHPISARRVRIGYTIKAIIGKATLNSQIENMIARGFCKIPLQERDSLISQGIFWSAAEFAPFQYSYAGMERYAALNIPIHASTKITRYFFILRNIK